MAIVSFMTASLNLLCIKLLEKLVLNEDKLLGFISLVCLAVISGLINVLIAKYSSTYFESKLVSYREKLANQILNSPFESVSKSLDRLATTLLIEINEVGYFAKLIPGSIISIVQIIAIVTYLFTLSWKVSVVVLLIFLMVSLLMFFILPKMKQLRSRCSLARYQLHIALNCMSHGIKNLMLNRKHGEHFVKHSIRVPSQDAASQSIKIHTLGIATEQVINIFMFTGFGISILLSFYWIQITQGLALQFLALFLFILPSFIRVIDFLNHVKSAENALDQVSAINMNLECQPNERQEREIQFAPKKHEPLISLKNVEYAYSKSKHDFNFGPISLSILENEIIIIKGGNGSGKTTLFNLILGLFQPISGQLYFQDNIVTRGNRRSYQKLISCYFTDSPVFDDMSYLPKCRLQKSKGYIAELELEGKTSINEAGTAGTNLSFGQQGRLSLLRLLLEDSPIFMFDEWAANQDAFFKDKFYKQIIPSLKSKGKTIILISHDDRYHEIADKIVTVQNGLLDSVVMCK